MTTKYDPSFEADFGDGTYRFRLCGIKEWAELEEKVGCGIFVLLERLRTRQCTAADIHETIRISLVGGGIKPVEAISLVRRYVVDRPLSESWGIAMRCVMSAVFGPEELTEKKAEAEGEGEPETDA